jgi:mycothiol synthase
VLFRRYSSLARQEVRLIVEDDEAKVGWGRLEWWDEADGTRLYLLSGGVAVPRRRQGIGSALLARLEDEAAALWRAETGAGTALLGGRIDSDDPETLALFTAAGYSVRFTLVDLARDPAGATGETALPPGVELRPVEPEQHPAIHAAIQASFDHVGLGQLPFSYAEYLADFGAVFNAGEGAVSNAGEDAVFNAGEGAVSNAGEDAGFSAGEGASFNAGESAGFNGDALVAWDEHGVAAVVINNVLEPGVADTPWVAVLPHRRRQGLASALLRRNLTRLAANGIREARIRTVQENPNDTVALYESLGYRITGRTPRYAKPLSGDQPGA